MPLDRLIQPLMRHDAAGLPAFRAESPDRHADRSLRRLGMLLFLASLSMLFAASLIAFVAVRWSGGQAAAPAAGYFPVPAGFYYSTVVLLAAGVVIELAARSTRPPARRATLLGAWLLSAAFIGLQTPPLVELYQTHAAAAAAHGTALAGLVFTLIVIHALHVIGGMVPLTVVAFNQVAPRRRNPSAGALRATALYWHFLDAVWLTMLATFLLAR